MIKSVERLLLQSLEAPGASKREGLSSIMVPMFLLFFISGSFLAEGLPSTELKQFGAIVKRLEAIIERQDAEINELQSKHERMETKANRTEDALVAFRDTELLKDKALRDLPYIMMCAYQGTWFETGIIGYEKLTLDYSNCDRPGGGCSGMDIASGTFTAQTGGLYTVTFSGQADLKPSTALQLSLLHNGSKLQESYSSSYSKSGTGSIDEMFSKTLVRIFSTASGALVVVVV